MSSVFETMTGLLQQGDLLKKLEEALGGSESDTAKAVNTAGPAIVGSLADKASAQGGPEAVGNILDTNDGLVLRDVGSFLDRGPTATGASAANSVFGKNQQKTVSHLAAESGLGGGILASALPMLTPIVLGILAKRRDENGLSNDVIAEQLVSEKAELISNDLLGEIPVASSSSVKETSAATHATTQAAATAKPKAGLGWIWPAIGLVALLIGVGWAVTNLGGEGELADSSDVSMEVTVPTGSGSSEIDDTSNDDGIDIDGTEGDVDVTDSAAVQTQLDLALSEVDNATAVIGSVDGDGVATLTGSADDEETRSAAEEAASNVEGVTSVVNDIELTASETTSAELDLEPITFSLNSAQITEQGKSVLDEAVTFFETNADLTFEVGGHTDDDGSDQANQALSVARAEAVKTYLQTNGIDEDRMSVKGYGKTEPTAPNDSEENKAANRRIEFTIN